MFRKIALLLCALLFLQLSNYSAAEAATDNYAVTVPIIETGDNRELGSIAIREDVDTDAFFKPDDVITVILLSGVEYAGIATVGEVVYAEGQGVSDDNALKYLSYVDRRSSEQGILWWEIVAAGDDFISVKANATEDYANTGGESTLYFHFNEPDFSCVDVDRDVTGDIKVEICALGTAVTSEFVTVARVFSGDTITTISKVNHIKIGTTEEIGTIRISETTPGLLKASATDYIKLTLPEGFRWVLGDNFSITGTNGLEAEIAAGWEEQTLCIEITQGNSGSQPGFISLSGLMINVPEETTSDVVVVEISGNKTTSESIVVAELEDYGVEIYTGHIPTIQTGIAHRIADIQISELGSESLISGRTVKMALPEGARWVYIDEDSDNGVALDFVGYKQNQRVAVWQVNGTSTDAATLYLEDMKIIVEPWFAGNVIMIEVTGSAGLEGRLPVAFIESPPEQTSFAIDPAIGILDNSFNLVNKNLIKGNQYYLNTKITNLTDSMVPALVITKVTNNKGEIVQFDAIKTQYNALQTNEYYTLFTPDNKGEYIAEVFVWSNWLSNNGKPLAESMSINIVVD